MRLFSFFLFLLFFAATPVHAYDLAALCMPGGKAAYVPINQRLDTGLLFRADHCSHTPSYIFGTLHSDNPALMNQMQPAFDAAKHSRIALFELLSSPEMDKDIAQRMVFSPTEKKTLSALLGEEDFQALLKAMQTLQPQFTAPALDRYKPWAAGVLLQYIPPAGDGAVLDERLQRAARKANVALLALEELSEQFAVFENMNEREQLAMLRDTMRHLKDIRVQNDRLLALYSRRELGAIAALGEEAFNEISDPKLREALRQAVIVSRNRTMTQRMLPHLADGEAFVAIGALHLPGQEGVLRLLEDAGYFIEAVY